MVYRSILKKFLIYAMLIVGSIVFSLPFLWMAATSFKVERELYTKHLRLLPIKPDPKFESPYLDDRYFEKVEGPHREELLEELSKLARDTGFEIPDDIDKIAAERQIAVGLYQKMTKRLPKEIWGGSPTEIVAAAHREIDLLLVVGNC